MRRLSPVEMAMAVPAIISLLAAGIIVAAAARGRLLFTGPQDITLGEAAAVRDHAAILRLIENGADPNSATLIRDRFVGRHLDTEVTPVEAAIGGHHLDTIQFLVLHGARIDERNRVGLMCFALQERQREMVAYLQSSAANPGGPDCTGVTVPWP